MGKHWTTLGILMLAGCVGPSTPVATSLAPPPSPTPSASPSASSSASPSEGGSQPTPLGISGQIVKASDGKALSYAIISFPELGIASAADAYGNFSLTGVAPGSHQVLISGSSLTTPVKKTLTIEANGALTISLSNQELGITATGGGGGGGGGGGTPTGGGASSPSPQPSSAATATPPPTSGSYDWNSKLGSDTSTPQAGSYQSDFQATPIGQEPADWTDAINDLMGKPAWLFAGIWSVQATSGGYAFNQSQTAGQPYFTMRRYKGNAFGTGDGAVPNHYQVSVKLQPLQSPYFKSPVGETALLAYYQDPGNYVKLVVQEASIDVWAATNAVPGESGGWQHLFSYPFTSQAGTTHTVGAIINANTGSLTPQIDGQQFQPVLIGKLTTKRHYVGLCGAGNSFNAKDLVIQSM